MKTWKRKERCTPISSARWTAYAAAGAASALAGVSSAEGDIHYSGIINRSVDNEQVILPLDEGANLSFTQFTGEAHIQLQGPGGSSIGAFVGQYLFYAGVYVSNLGRGVKLRSQNFDNSCTRTSSSSQLVCYGVYLGGPARNGYFKHRSEGYVGFNFDRGAGNQFGWARVKTSGLPNYRLIIVAYAWADPGDKLSTGQTGQRNVMGALPDRGSLGLLALGSDGLLRWREERQRVKTLE